MSVAGFDDLAAAWRVSPALTTAHQPPAGTAQAAVQMPGEIIEDRSAPTSLIANTYRTRNPVTAGR